ncbi:hypothetical protein PR002_g25491 [Phytophthora rubi]|uniref:START domain-containing protein n=1 Tax=Phytophthora rubi TaxID=129364 RepID=A0A6A3HYW5_9STRA|nr:hypothetical protein PR002_g25491 [Phytophthora rubi]
MFGAVASTTEAMRVKASYVKDMSGGSVLAVLEKPTIEEPFRSLTVRWIELDLPFASTPLIKNRDYVYVEYMNIVHLSNGERIGCQIYHSVNFPQTGDIPGRVRANMTVCGIFRQIGPDLVEAYGSGIVDPAGDMIKTLVVPSMATGYLTILKYAHCSEMKKITWLLRKRHAALKESGARPNRPPVDTRANSVVGSYAAGCRVQRNVAIVGVAGFLDHHKVTFCGRCLQQVRRMSPLEIAQEYAAGFSKQTISLASMDSSLSSSMSE